VVSESYTTGPAVPAGFYWAREPWGRVLRCRPLEAIAPHAFTTRDLPLASRADWDRLAAALGAAAVATLTQVHGRGVVVVGAADSRGAPDRPGAAGSPTGDVLVSNAPGVAVAVRAADCVPLLLADPASGAVAAVHAGWRGTAAGAARAAVEALEREYHARPVDMVAAIGPSIGACCYEVGSELIDAFLAAGHRDSDIERWFAVPPGAARPRLDTWGANRDQLIAAGLRPERVHTCGLCTAHHLELFPSFRVEKERAGRIAGAITAAARPLRPSPRSPADRHPC